MKKTILCLACLFLLTLSGCGQTQSATNISSLADLTSDDVALIALGNDDVPVGRYGKEALEASGLWDAVEGKISYATNVKEVLSQVEYGAVDCGIVYSTDTIDVEGIEIVEYISGNLLASPIYYPGAVLANSENYDLAQAFFYSLVQETELFETWGFTVLTPEVTECEVSEERATLTIFAAASLTELLTAYGEEFEATYPNIELFFNFDSSGTLRTQIEYGANCDLFLSASTSEMNDLVEGGYINSEDVTLILENQLVLIVPN